MGALGLDDRIEADAGIGQGSAHGGGGAGTIGQPPQRHLGLVAIQGHAAHGRLAQLTDQRILAQLALLQFEGLGGGPERLGPLLAGHQTTHLHLAGGDQAQVDAGAGQGVKQPGGHSGPAQNPGPGDAQLGHRPLGRELGAARTQLGPHAGQHLAAHQLGPIQISGRQREGDVVAAALLGGLHDQVHIQPRGAQGLEQQRGHPRPIGYMGEGQHRLSALQFRPIHRPAQLKPSAADRSGAAAGEPGAGGIAPA